MNWSDFLRGEMGWAAVAGMAAEFYRRLTKGDIVLRREYERLSEQTDEAIARADKLVDDANANATKTIEAQAKVIEIYELRQKEGA